MWTVEESIGKALVHHLESQDQQEMSKDSMSDIKNVPGKEKVTSP